VEAGKVAMRYSFKRGSGPNYIFRASALQQSPCFSVKPWEPGAEGPQLSTLPLFLGSVGGLHGGCDGIRNARLDALLDAGGRAVGDSFSVVACMYKVL
jgi:hypothetical protein